MGRESQVIDDRQFEKLRCCLNRNRAIFSAVFISVRLKSTGICCTTSHAEATSSFCNDFFFIIAVNAFPISNGKTSGAIKSWPAVSRMILSFSDSFKATAMNVFVSATIFIGTIVRINLWFVKPNKWPHFMVFIFSSVSAMMSSLGRILMSSTWIWRIIPCLPMKKSARSVVPSERRTPNFSATAPWGQKSDSTGNHNFPICLVQAKRVGILSTVIPKRTASFSSNSPLTMLYPGH